MSSRPSLNRLVRSAAIGVAGVRAQVEVRQSLEDRFRAEMGDLTAGQSLPEVLDERYSRWE